MIDREGIARQARVLKALGHPTRVAVLEALRRHGELCVCELHDFVPGDQSTLSRHLSCLRQAGLLLERRDGVRVLHRVADASVYAILDTAAGICRAPRAAAELRG